jgi:hypothetical protein
MAYSSVQKMEMYAFKTSEFLSTTCNANAKDCALQNTKCQTWDRFLEFMQSGSLKTVAGELGT